MKGNRHILKFSILILGMAIALSLIVMGCRKPNDPPLDKPEVTVKSSSMVDAKLTLSGAVSFRGPVKNLTLLLGKEESLTDASRFEVETNDNSFSVTVDGMEIGVTYYYSFGVDHGAPNEFLTEVSSLTFSILATVTTNEVADVTIDGAKVYAEVTADGGAEIIERGVFYGTTHNPIQGGSRLAAAEGGMGSYMVELTGLMANTTYYVQAYAINSTGTSSGKELSFTTVHNYSLAVLTTDEVTNVTATTAVGGGAITDTGGTSVLEAGICWSTAENPTTTDSHAFVTEINSTFSVTMTDLTPGTVYHVRAYAINSVGTSYGQDVTFTTVQ